jgi:hypothetical protein
VFPLILLIFQSLHSVPCFLEIAIQIDKSEELFDHSILVLGCPSGGFGFSTSEYSISKSTVSDSCVGRVHSLCCG